ncbi:uncharacterized protein TNCV_317731 [Trichonephila clavipes]|nr:uncharacterized protein TNCV_317731 [Trichonephila clavipes]
MACLVTSSSPVPLKTHRVEQRCTLNLSRAEMSTRWCGVVVRRGVLAQVSSTSLDHGSKLRGPSSKALVCKPLTTSRCVMVLVDTRTSRGSYTLCKMAAKLTYRAVTACRSMRQSLRADVALAALALPNLPISSLQPSLPQALHCIYIW